MPAILSYFASTRSRVSVSLFVFALLYSVKRLRKSAPNKSPEQPISSNSKKQRRIGVDAQFLKEVRKILPICIPGITSRETGLLIMLAVVLIIRSWLDIWFSAFNGTVVKAIVSRDRATFVSKAIFEFAVMMWPLSIVNNSLKYLINALSLSFRSRLTFYAHNEYLREITFYKMINLDNRIQNVDQLLTQDINKFSDSLSHLYSDTAKPIVDIFLFAYKLGQAIGKGAPFYMVLYFFMSAVFLRTISPPFGKYTASEQYLEGQFRYAHSRIITHSEEIAFYKGADRERELVNNSFAKIVRHVRKIYRLRFLNGVFDSILVKYCATMIAYYLLARPVFESGYSNSMMGPSNSDPTKIMEDYSRNSGYLINLSQAVGRLILAGRDITRFAGYTARVHDLFNVLDDVNKGLYERTFISQSSSAVSSQRKTLDTTQLPQNVTIKDHVIEFDQVPIVTPNGDILLRELNFRVEMGMNCLITGPNGCGKSSLFRILGDLWPLFGGKVIKPASNQLFYVPQKPYLSVGTFRDQVIYPDSQSQMLNKGYDDSKLLQLLGVVHLGYLVDREGGWDSVRDWADVLSGGEKQRVAMARLFYHHPQFAILDECTSQVSVDIEGIMYNYAKRVGITLFTVSHRPSLYKYHDYLIRFDGEGNYQFTKLVQDDISEAFSFGHGKSQPSEQYQDGSVYSASEASEDVPREDD